MKQTGDREEDLLFGRPLALLRPETDDDPSPVDASVAMLGDLPVESESEGLFLSPGTPLNVRTVKSARRAFEIFEFFVEHRRPANILTIAQALGYPPSSTAALTKSLAILGYLHYDAATRTFFPTLRISLLGGWLQDQYFTDSRILELMNAIARRTRQTVILAMQSGIHVQYLMVIDGNTDLKAYIRIGSLRPICRASTGKMLLTLMSERQLRGVVNHANALEDDPAHKVSFRELLADVDLCRQRGFATTSGTVTPGLGTVAMLLPTTHHHAPLAIAVGGPADVQEKEQDRWAEALRQSLAEFFPSDPPPAG